MHGDVLYYVYFLEKGPLLSPSPLLILPQHWKKKEKKKKSLEVALNW